MGEREIGVELWSILDDKEVEALEKFTDHFVDKYYEDSTEMFRGFFQPDTYEEDKKNFCREFKIDEKDLDDLLEASKFKERVNTEFEVACDDLYYEIEKYRRKRNYTI